MKCPTFLVLAIASALLKAATPALSKADRHPLDPLTKQEIATVTRLLKADPRVPAGAFFPTLVLNEPPKEAVLNFTPGARPRREAYVEIFDRPNNALYEAVVDLTGNKVLSFKALPSGTQPAVFLDEFRSVPPIVRNDKEWVRAMQRRGIHPADVYLDVWAGGDLPVVKDREGKPVPENTRIMRVLSFFRGKLPNPYDRPIEGVVVAVDMNRLRVLQVLDTGIRPLSRDSGEPDPDSEREPLKPLRVRQPQGPSYQVNGHEVRWQNWRFRFALHPRDGLVLYRVSYLQGGRVRPIAYRIGLAELYVPYGLPDINWVWRTAFDAGEYGLGRYANSLASQVDVPENATFFNAHLANDRGDSFVIPKAIALYERDGGVLWKRVDPTSAKQDARLGRELVITSNAWIGNYVYGLSYIFRQDGSLEIRADLTGTMLNRGVHTVEEGDGFGAQVTNYVAAPNHQHFLNFRLDLDIDETVNRVVESNVSSIPSALGNAFVATETLLKTEDEAQRDLNPATARTWTVKSANVTNALGHATGYTLRPADNAFPYSDPNFAPRRRAAFVEHTLWVTTYKPHEMYAAGPYPYQGRAGEGLPQYTNGESIVNQDIVLWYTVGITHPPEIEEYPVMTTASIGFRLTPDGFFSRNPALNVPLKQVTE
jgi:primary-amine oxidase